MFVPQDTTGYTWSTPRFRLVVTVLLVAVLAGGAGYGVHWIVAHVDDSDATTPPPAATAIEQLLIARTEGFYAQLAQLNATQAMTLLHPWSSAASGYSGINDAALGGIDPASDYAIQRLGAAQVLQLALYAGQPQYLSEAIAVVQDDIAIRIMQFRLWTLTPAAISDGGPNGDIHQRAERGDIAWEAWLLHQAGAYFTAPPGQAEVNTTQWLIEQFTTDYVEDLCNTTTWPTDGYNKEVVQGVHPAAIMGLYGETAFQQLWPNTHSGFFDFWDGMMLGQLGSYEPDNSPGYRDINVGAVLGMALWLNRVNRTADTATDPHAYLSDSLDLHRVIDNMSTEMMPNGNVVNYNKGIPHWYQIGNAWYAWNSPLTSRTFIYYMGYRIYGDPKLLYVARKMEMFMAMTGRLPPTLLIQTEVWPPNIRELDTVLGVPPPPIVSELTWQRIDSFCYGSILPCRPAPQWNTVLYPDKIVLRAGTEPGSDFNPYVFMSVSPFAQHANPDQQMTLENTLYNGSYITARVGSTIADPYGLNQVNQCNCVLVAPANASVAYPFIHDITPTFYSDMLLNPAIDLMFINNYVLQSAQAQQLDDGNGYGSLLFSHYLYYGVRAARQVVLTAQGIIVVVDTVYNVGTSGLTLNGGVTYRLWPGVTASDTNWALQSPLTALSSTTLLSPNINTSTLFWVNTAANRVIGLDTEPLTDFDYGGPGQTASTLYAYDHLSTDQPSTFVSVLYPLPVPSQVASIASQISVSTSTTDGSTLVDIPNQPRVTVPYLDITPVTSGGPVVWLSAQSLSNDRPLTAWSDSSGHNNVFTALDLYSAPTVSGSVMNGYPAVRFQGGQALANPSVFPIYTDYTYIALLQLPQVTSSAPSGVLGSHTGGQYGLAAWNFRFTAQHSSIVVKPSTPVPVIAINQPQLVSVVWQQTLGVLSVYVNGTLTINTSPPSTTQAVSDPSLVLGCYGRPDYAWYNGYMSEFMLWNYALTATHRAAAEQSILARYDLD